MAKVSFRKERTGNSSPLVVAVALGVSQRTVDQCDQVLQGNGELGKTVPPSSVNSCSIFTALAVGTYLVTFEQIPVHYAHKAGIEANEAV